MAKPHGRFKKGDHWREPKPFWDKAWLENEYETKGRSCGDIAKDFGLRENALHYWLRKHGIRARTMAEARKAKRWSVPREKNGMTGRTGSRAPGWRGGLTPLRQSLYQTKEWKDFASAVRRRDKSCRLCGGYGDCDIHHIVRFSDAPLLFMDELNAILLCKKCHRKTYNREKRWAKKLMALLNGEGGQ